MLIFKKWGRSKTDTKSLPWLLFPRVIIENVKFRDYSNKSRQPVHTVEHVH